MLVESLSNIIYSQRPMTLKALEVKDLRMDTKSLRLILKAVQKNTSLRSINFGCLMDPEQKSMVEEMLRI